jgi:chemotaxis protein methyltransferase CheR
VRRQVCRRLQKRARELGLADLEAYRARLESDPLELAHLATLARVTISRFYRDRAVFDALRPVLSRLAHQANLVRILSAGCASGEEPYTIALLWSIENPRTPLELVAVDLDEEVLARAREGVYDESSLSELPEALREAGFAREGDRFCLEESLRKSVTYLQADIRKTLPEGPFDLVFCRNLAFTYFDEPAQRELARRLRERMRSHALLLVGSHEHPTLEGFVPSSEVPHAYRLTSGP